MRRNLIALLLTCAGAVPALVAAPAAAAPVEQLQCLDDRLNDQQSAGIAGLFAEQGKDPNEPAKPATGSASAAYDLTFALSSCSSQFGWNRAQQDAATHYLISSGQLARIAIKHSPDWTSALDRAAPLAVRLLPEGKAPDDHIRDMVLAGAMANGRGAVSRDSGDDVMAYFAAWQLTERARAEFGRAL